MTKNGFHLREWCGQGLLAALMFVLVFSMTPVQAAEETNLMERWLVNDSLSKRVVDNSIWQRLLDTYLVEGVFNFAAVTDQDQAALQQYITLLGRTDVDRLKKSEQMAFWINAYNALIVGIVLEEYPVRSINDIGGSFFSPGPWKEKRFRVYQINLSLNHIYHRILRPIWGDFRIHYALGCSGISCPALAPNPYVGETIEDSLRAAQDAYINHGPAIRQIKEAGVTLSRIYDWYGDDFGQNEAEILKQIKEEASGDMATRLAPVTRISSYGFDWDLSVPNGHPTDD